MGKIQKYTQKTLTPKTRLSDLVNKKYHHQLKLMIDELRNLTAIGKETDWWRVNRLDFTRRRSSENYRPIARFIKSIEGKEGKVLNCSKDTFFYYITHPEHSNLKIKPDSLKSLVHSMIALKHV